MPTNTPRFALLGDRVAVDFANTAQAIAGTPGALEDWAGLVAFLEQAQVISGERASALLALKRTDPQTVESLLRKALALRAGLVQALGALARREPVEHASILAINDLLRITEGHDELVPEGPGWKLQFVARERHPEWLLTAIARSAAEIISEGAAALRRCANPECPLLFYDDSRNGRRRWCAMASCGNRSKVAAFAKRKVKRGGGR
ncbi:MAG: CGNR zinc finger domain-containing protein [Acidobacteriia bacterium]|nr:CGNR zinc finger domain-containing protein [Terriglobia bacterium]